ncbi:sensor histidine kinase [Breznakia pachnodae]|uniref:histidine kinase n=1 Tax=Breznakia pachnodae TaxID=265178 RepID=A0ABU0E873_9FIRM|nr:HAMP domain-containing sensor histidine kinase [Breznakia pachnodae]MDQ0363106.1 histidine kinase [Breznakia pachnodae]
MKKLSIYWKTVVVSITIILVTVVSLFIVVSILTPYLTQEIQKERFNEQIEAIQESIEENGINTDELEKLIENNLYFEIYENGEMIYNSITIEVAYNPEQNNGNDENSFVIPSFMDTDTLEHEEEVIYQGNAYDLFVTKTITFTMNESTMLLNKILPYFLIIGSIAAILLSIIYARFFSKKIKRLSTIMDKMKEKDYKPNNKKIDGDELQRLENDVNSLYSQLLEEITIVNKFEEERQLFLRGITHELKTPIMAMGVTIEGILAKVDGYDNYEEALNDCYQELQSMSNLVNEILDLAKIQSVKDVGTINVSEAIDKILEIYQFSFIDKHISVNKNQMSEMQLTIPENHFNKVLSNIISNVTKYTPEHGKFDINIDDKCLRFVNTVQANTDIKVDKIFDAFVTSDSLDEKELYKSHGLGLYITSSILKQYHINYKCWVEDNFFYFEIFL